MKIRRLFMVMMIAILLLFSIMPSSVYAEEIIDSNKENEENDGDPGAGRLQGFIPEEFFGVTTNSRSSYQHASKFESGYTIENGIDVSQWNGTINWKKVKQDGIDFAIIRVARRTYGSGEVGMDSSAIKNIEGALAAGIPVGVYFFSQAITTKEAEEEAEYILSKIKGYDITLPVVFDFEFASDENGLTGRLYKANLSKTKATNVCLAFCEKVEKAGYTPMVYGNPDMFNNHLYPSKISDYYPIWLAHYTYKTNYSGDYNYWQYTANGKVDGISGNVDMNFRYIKKEEKVSNLEVSTNTTDSIELKWDKYSDATGYYVYRKQYGGTYEVISTVSSNSYTDESLVENNAYIYKVRAYTDTTSGRDESYCSSAVIGTTIVVDNFKEYETTFDSITLNWKGISQISGYQLQKYDSQNKKWVTLKTISDNSIDIYKDHDLNANTVYGYRIRGYLNVGNSIGYGLYSSGIKVYTKTSVLGNIVGGNVSVKSGAGNGYTELKVLAEGKEIKIAGSNGDWYRIYITLNGGTQIGYVPKTSVKIQEAESIGTTVLTGDGKSFDSVELKWDTISNVSGYELQKYDSTNKVWKTLTKLEGEATNTYTDTELNANTVYGYRIRGYKSIDGNESYGTYSTGIKVQTTTTVLAKLNSDVNVYSGPGNSYNIIKELSVNKNVKLAGSSGAWYRIYVVIDDKNEFGYVKKDYVELIDSTISISTTNLEEKSTSFDRITISWEKIEDATGYQLQKYNSTTKVWFVLKNITGNTTISYTDYDLNANTMYGYRIRGLKDTGTSIIYGDYSDGIKIKTTISVLAEVNGTNVNVRSGAGLSYSILKTFDKGKSIKVAGSNGDWYRIYITLNGETKIGYISKEYVSLLG